jgi:hypothetical protein
MGLLLVITGTHRHCYSITDSAAVTLTMIMKTISVMIFLVEEVRLTLLALIVLCILAIFRCAQDCHQQEALDLLLTPLLPRSLHFLSPQAWTSISHLWRG